MRKIDAYFKSNKMNLMKLLSLKDKANVKLEGICVFDRILLNIISIYPYF